MTITEIVQTIKIPDGIQSEIHGHKVTIKSDKGELTKNFKSHRLAFEQKENNIIVIGEPANKNTRALLHTVVAHVKNMILGLRFGFKYTMAIHYSHFPMTAEVNNKKLIIKNFLGEKHPREAKIVGDTKVEVKGQEIIISGQNIENVGQTVANIEQRTRVNRKDIRRFSDGIYLAKKETIEEVPHEFKLETMRGRE
jgi:large subunit ribosomal protein L6